MLGCKFLDFFLRFCSFICQRERARENTSRGMTEAEGEAGFLPGGGPDAGLDPGTLGS